MSWAMVGSAAISVVGGMMAKDSAGSASSAQGDASAAAIKEQKRQFDLNRKDLEPWKNVGSTAVNKLGVLLGLQPNMTSSPSSARTWQSFYDEMLQKAPTIQNDQGGIWTTPDGGGLGGGSGGAQVWVPGPGTAKDAAWAKTEADKAFAAQKDQATAAPDADFGALNKKFTLDDFWDDPVTKASFEFGLSEGTKALGNMAGAKGNRNSGAQLKALSKFATDYTGGQAVGSYNRFYGDQDRTYNRLAGVSGTGQTAATNTAVLGQQNANNISGLISAQGNARGAAAIAGSNAMASGLKSGANTLANWWNNQGSNSNYNSAGTFQPFYTGYSFDGGSAYG